MFWLLFEFGPLLVWLGMLVVVVRPLGLGRLGQWTLSLILLALTQKFLIYRIFGGSAFVPDLPEGLIHATGWTYSSCMILFVLSFICWLAQGLHALLRRDRPHNPSSVSRIRRQTALLAVVSAALAGWGIWEGVRVPHVRTVDVEVPGLPKAFEGFRIVHLSDLHCSPAARRMRTQRIVEAVNGLRPDLVCITGDFVDGSVAQRLDDLAPLKGLRAAQGVFGCAGNHEYYSDYAQWKPALESLGVCMLDNEHRTISRGDGEIALGGVTDVAAWNNGRCVMEGPDVAKAFEGTPTNACRILLRHRPDDIAEQIRNQVRLQLSGHTHGGAILGIDRLVRRANEGHVRGLYRAGPLTLHVSPGTGQWAGFPLRLGVPGEITELRLHVPAAPPTSAGRSP